jgi:hypothetical protein
MTDGVGWQVMFLESQCGLPGAIPILLLNEAIQDGHA